MTLDFARGNRRNHQHDLLDAARGWFDHVGDGLGIGDMDSVAARHFNDGGAGPFRHELLGGIGIILSSRTWRYQLGFDF